MVAPIKGKIQGGSNFLEIAKGLREMPAKFVIQDVKAEQKACWEIVLKAAIGNAPVDSGRLREMIALKVGFNKKTGNVYALVGLRRITRKMREKIQSIKKFGRTVSKKDGSKVLRGPSRKELDALEYDAYYGVFVEFGTEHQTAQPFMRPAFDQNFQSVFTIYGEKLRARVAKRLAALKARAQRRSDRLSTNLSSLIN